MKKTEIPLGRSDCISKKKNERPMTQLQIKIGFSSLVPPHTHTHTHRSMDLECRCSPAFNNAAHSHG